MICACCLHNSVVVFLGFVVITSVWWPFDLRDGVRWFLWESIIFVVLPSIFGPF